MKYFTLNELEALELVYKHDHTVLTLIETAKEYLQYQTETEE